MSRTTRTLAVAISVLAVAGATISSGTTVAAANPTRPTNPWTDANYQPTPGQWRNYVLAPTSHTVRPTSVLSADDRDGRITGDPKATLSTRSSVTLTSTGGVSASPLLSLDFGKEVGGEVTVHVLSTSSPAPQLHVCFSESRADMALTPSQNNGEAAYAPGCDTANIWNGYPGTAYTFDSDSHILPLSGAKLPATLTDTQPRGGFRYATLFLDGPGSVTLNNVGLIYQAAPLQKNPADYQGWFLSSSNALNKLWYAGAYTVQTDTWLSNTAKSWPYNTGEADHSDAQIPHADPKQEVILDGAKRDRVVWQGDLSVEAPVTYLSTGDIGAVDNSLSSLAAQQLPNGFVPAESLVGQHNLDEETTYGEYVTWFIYNAYEHWLYTGDRAYLAANWSGLQKATAWLESVREQDPQGLIAFESVGSCGHYGYSDCGHETYVNALYDRNLAEMASLAAAVGDQTDRAVYAGRAGVLKQAINTQLWDPTVGAYRLSREVPNAYPQDANATAVLAGIATPDQANAALAYLRKNNWSTLGSFTMSPNTPNPVIGATYEPLPSGFEAEARLSGDSLSQVQGEQLLNRYWNYQLSQDPGSTFWEKVNPAGDPSLAQFTSLSHGWAAAPTVTLTNQVLGMTPTSGGYGTFDLVPHPGDLSWAQGVVPTPHGSISASWQVSPGNFSLNAIVPSGTTGRLAVPTNGAKVAVWLDGRLVWNGRPVGRAQASSADGYIYLAGVGQGHHQVTSRPLSSPSTEISVVSTADSTSAMAGGSVSVAAAVTGVSGRSLTTQVTPKLPAGWTATPAGTTLRLGQDGRPGTATAHFTVTVPKTAAPGAYPITVVAQGNGVTAQDQVMVTVDPPGYSFESGTQGWQAGSYATGVAQVSSFANRPGSCVSGDCLQVSTAAVAATTVRSAFVTPSQPLDLSTSSALSLQFNCYGGVPNATGYQAIVTLTGSDSSTLTKTFPVDSDTWSTLTLDLAGWAGAKSVSRIEVGFSAAGTDYPSWSGAFELDDISWS